MLRIWDLDFEKTQEQHFGFVCVFVIQAQIRRLLENNPEMPIFSVVDSAESMILVGEASLSWTTCVGMP